MLSSILKLSVVSVVLGSYFVAAQNIPGLPDCAKGCVADALKDSGCSADDAVCQCSDTTSGGLGFLNGINRCTPFAGCSADDSSITYNLTHAYCDAALGTS